MSAGSASKLEVLAEQAAGCTKCRLSEARTNVVFGMGAPNADLMIIGEGPGKREDEQGLPFVGPSGKLLDQLLEEVGLRREENVYIANVVKCRPPGNRDPRDDEIESCKPYLRGQLEMVDPAVVLTLGNFSSKLLLRTSTGITKLRGQAYPWWRRHLVPTFHPAAALRGSARVLEEMRFDFALVRSVIDGRFESSATSGTGTEDPGAASGIETTEDVAPSPSGDEVDAEQMGLW